MYASSVHESFLASDNIASVRYISHSTAHHKAATQNRPHKHHSSSTM